MSRIRWCSTNPLFGTHLRNAKLHYTSSYNTRWREMLEHLLLAKQTLINARRVSFHQILQGLVHTCKQNRLLSTDKSPVFPVVCCETNPTWSGIFITCPHQWTVYERTGTYTLSARNAYSASRSTVLEREGKRVLEELHYIKKASNKSCWKLNFVQKSLGAHMSISSTSGAVWNPILYIEVGN